MKREILKTVFALKTPFGGGLLPPPRVFDNVEIAPYAGDALAAATISADFEISWAFRGRGEAERLELAKRCRHNVPLIVRLLQEQDVPITWATVGHLFLDHCERDPSGLAHADMPRPPKNLRWEGDWYRHDPCTNLEQHPYWYAPDLIAIIRGSSTRHEIGSHSFSHIDFSADTSTPELVRREMEACQRVMSAQGLQLRSLVYPFNNMGHHYLELLGSMGLIAVRHRDPKISISYPEETPHGVYKLYETMNFRRAKHYDYIDKAGIYLAASCERYGAYHLWFHPSDPTEFFEREFHGIIKQMAALRKEGKLWTVTMGDLAAYCEARRRATLAVQNDGPQTVIRVKCDHDTKRYGKTSLTLRLQSAAPPKQCRLTLGGENREVAWREAAPRPNQSARAFLLDAPAADCQLRVIF